MGGRGARAAGFTVERIHPLQHYARTLDHWSGALAQRHTDAVCIALQETYDTR